MTFKVFRTTYYRDSDSTIQLSGKLNSFNIKDFCTAFERFYSSGKSNVTIDFERVERAYPSGVLPIITSLDIARDKGIKIYVKLPNNDNTRKLFRSVNWAHFLSPEQFEKSESVHDRHLVTRRFENAEQQKAVVDDFMDVVLRSMTIPRDIISGLEWSINEITDNVLNHSESKHGGIIQASTYPKDQTIAFAVADSGRGILKSMQEGFPSLRTDLQAIGEAVKAGVTRNPKFGQGNGLAGSLKVTTLTGGSFDLTSGAGRFVATNEQTLRKPLFNGHYQGTVVCGQIKITENFKISDALDFGTGIKYIPVDIVEMQYEMEDKDCLILKMKDETTGFGTRKSGAQIRTKLKNLLNAQPTYPLVASWEGVPVISSSFADEVMGKLFIELGALTFTSRIRNVGMEQLVHGLLDKAIGQRLTQEKDSA
jgi:anti-sigma regulatory factor (Ser/Thr protein kinase)